MTNHVNSHTLQARTGLPSIKDLALRSECVLAWQLLSDNGDMRELAIPCLCQQDHGYPMAVRTVGEISAKGHISVVYQEKCN
jgi:hypothetical protein